MESLSTKIIMTGVVGMLVLFCAYFLMATYANSLVEDRTVGHLLVQIRLSPLSETEQNKLLNDFNNYQAQTKRGLRLDITRSDAQMDKKGLGSLECTALMIDFEKAARTCLADMGTNPLEVIFSSCPPADILASKLQNLCNFNTGWR